MLVCVSGDKGETMSEPEVMMPVRCPECGGESLCSLIVAVAADALLAGRPVRLRVDCHGREWEANSSEREQLREYLGATCFRLGGAAPPFGRQTTTPA
jgi:hypothetical protein